MTGTHHACPAFIEVLGGLNSSSQETNRDLKTSQPVSQRRMTDYIRLSGALLCITTPLKTLHFPDSPLFYTCDYLTCRHENNKQILLNITFSRERDRRVYEATTYSWEPRDPRGFAELQIDWETWENSCLVKFKEVYKQQQYKETTLTMVSDIHIC